VPLACEASALPYELHPQMLLALGCDPNSQSRSITAFGGPLQADRPIIKLVSCNLLYRKNIYKILRYIINYYKLGKMINHKDSKWCKSKRENIV
jgi:hypothetical protein